MNIQSVRIFSVIILSIILYSKQYQILYYFPIMLLSLEYLNQKKDYFNHYNSKILNTLFIGYVVFICIERGRPFAFNMATEIILNSIEHILFGFIICIKASVYYSLLKKKFTLNFASLLKIAFVFNIFGFLNEFFQNWYKHQSQWSLNFDSKKDILMNITGSIFFIIFYQRINKNIQSQT